jgi:hypothetical protein
VVSQTPYSILEVTIDTLTIDVCHGKDDSYTDIYASMHTCQVTQIEILVALLRDHLSRQSTALYKRVLTILRRTETDGIRHRLSKAIDRSSAEGLPRDRILDVPYLTAVEVGRSLPRRPTLLVDFAAKRLTDFSLG